MTTTIYWCNDGEDHFEDVPTIEMAYRRAESVVLRYRRSVWFYDPREGGGFIRVYEHTRRRAEVEPADKDMVPKQLQLVVLLGEP